MSKPSAMKPLHWAGLVAGAAVLAAGGTAMATGPKKTERNTPSSWSYEIRNGKRVPRVQRKVNPDGSWTEQRRVGNCTVTRNGRDGEVRETRTCD